MYKNQTNSLKVFAFNRLTGSPLTGDAANITCKVSIDGGSRVALADTNPTEMEDGYYLFDVTAAESNGTTADFFPESATSNIQVICVEHGRYLLNFPTNFSSLAISAGGVVDADVKLWRGTQPNILQSGRVDAYAGAFVSGAIPDTESIADAVWDEATSGHTIAGTYGKLVTTVETKIDVVDDYVDTEVAAIKAKTDQLNFTIAGQVDANALTGGGGGGLTQAQVRQAVGLASANLDTQLAGIESDTNSIIASLSGAAVTLVSPVTDLGALVVFNGRTYGGSAHAAIQFTVAKNYAGATYVELVLFTLGDPTTELQTLSATVASSTSVTVSGTINATGEYLGEVAVLVAGYTLQASWGGSMETIATGKAYIYKQPS